MKNSIVMGCMFGLSMFCSSVSFGQRDYTKLVNPFIGTGGHGHTYPGATSPFGMVQLSPDTRMADWDGSSGYHYSDKEIYGFSHTHLSGTGVPDYCDILVMPTLGAYKFEAKANVSNFSHQNEKAYAGYYSVLLDKHSIQAELTTTTRTGVHRYTYPAGTTEGNIMIDLAHRDEVLESYIEILNDNTIQGYRFSKSWAKNQKLYFYAKFNKAIIRHSIHTKDSTAQSLSNNFAKGKAIFAGLTFKLDNQPLQMQLALSATGMEQAKLNYEAEAVAGFDAALQANIEQWNKELGRIEIESFPFKNIDTIFYTAFYHTLIVPNIYQDVNGKYRGTGDDIVDKKLGVKEKILDAKNFTNYTVFSLWDTYRAYHPLMSVLQPKRTRDWIHSFINQYKNGGMLPVWELSANETFCMIGYHSAPVILDAYRKGIRDFDHETALKALIEYSNSNRFGISQYAKYGFLSNSMESESVSKTMEYAYDDWCIAEYASLLGKKSIAEEYYKRSLYYRNVYNPSSGFFHGKQQNNFVQPFNPYEINNYYTEGNAWHYSLAAPHDVAGMRKLMGNQGFRDKLNNLFTTTTETTGRAQADVTGLIGQYAHGNEPSHHMAYMWNYAGRPDQTGYYVNKICNDFYTNKPDGLIGNEDCGQMSAWYLWSALGMYPVNPASNKFVTGSPQVKKAIIHLENGKDVTIDVIKMSTDQYVVDTILANGSIHPTTILNFSQFNNGGQIVFKMATEAEFAKRAAPPSTPEDNIVDDADFVAVPFIESGDIKFRKKTKIKLGRLDPKARLFYYFHPKSSWGSPYHGVFKFYKKPITISSNGTLYFYTQKDRSKSAVIEQEFIEVKKQLQIEVLSKVSPMYTAGGSEALVDGVKGTTNWRAGEWQSYQGYDFEAVVDLKKSKDIDEVTLTLLQDIGSWIWMPKEVQVYTSTDGKDYTLAGTATHAVSDKDETVQVKELTVSLKKAKGRYVKIVATKYGTIPEWHLGAGNVSHLFISEVEVK